LSGYDRDIDRPWCKVFQALVFMAAFAAFVPAVFFTFLLPIHSLTGNYEKATLTVEHVDLPTPHSRHNNSLGFPSVEGTVRPGGSRERVGLRYWTKRDSIALGSSVPVYIDRADSYVGIAGVNTRTVCAAHWEARWRLCGKFVFLYWIPLALWIWLGFRHGIGLFGLIADDLRHPPKKEPPKKSKEVLIWPEDLMRK